MALEIPFGGAHVCAERDLDFRGAFGVDRSAPVGFTAIRLVFELPADKAATFLNLTERYCVVLQTLRTVPALTAGIRSGT